MQKENESLVRLSKFQKEEKGKNKKENVTTKDAQSTIKSNLNHYPLY